MRVPMTPENWKPPLVVLVGMGMGPDDLGTEARGWVSAAEVLAGGARHLESFPLHQGERIPFKGTLATALDRIRDISSRKLTVVLCSGDPFFFSIGSHLAERVGKENVLALPNVTSLQVFFSRLGEPWENVKVWSLHGREPWIEPGAWLSRLSLAPVHAFFTDPEHSPAWIARQMIEARCTGWTMAVAEDLGTPTERVRTLPLPEAAEMAFSSLNMVALFSVDTPDPHPACEASYSYPMLGLPESAFRHEAGLITKMEIRVVSLAHLQLLPEQVLWDVGAGSGSVAVEAARLVPSVQVYAVEKEPRRFEDIQENIRRHDCRRRVHALYGAAPGAFRSFPDPDRVFIGGSGENLMEILEAVAARLRPAGRVVQTMVSLDNLAATRSFWCRKGFAMEVGQVQVSRGVPIGKGMRLEALNPVFILVVMAENQGKEK